MKKCLSLFLLLLIICTNSIANAYVIEDYDYSFKSKGYSTSSQSKVLNVYTDNTPISGDLVTLYNYSGSNTQTWVLESNINISPTLAATFRVKTKANENLALNYNQATTKCTVYTYSGNDTRDYPVYFDEDTADGGYVLWLVGRSGRYLGNSSNTNGAQCWWYLIGQSGIHEEDVWVIM